MSLRSACAVLVLVACAACPPPPAKPKPQALKAGVATQRLDIPVGTSMGGYTRQRPSDDPGSLWSKTLPASRGIATEPTARAVAFSDGLTQVVMIRLDGCISSPTLRARVKSLLSAAGKQANVIIDATHSHSAPARYLTPARLGSSTGSDFVSLVMDSYDPDVETRMATAIAAAAGQALDTLQPVSIGVATADGSAFNHDRRCQNDGIYGPNYKNSTMTVIRVDAVDDSGMPTKPLTALLHFSEHGTALDRENTYFSTEANGGLELYASDAIGVPVMYVQGSAGDVSPAQSPLGHEAMQDIERQGRAAAPLVAAAWAKAAPGKAATPKELLYLERGVTLSREAIGYDSTFPAGGQIQCGSDLTGECGQPAAPPASFICFPLEARKPFKTTLSLFQLYDIAFMTLPGEPSTGLAAKVIDNLKPLGATTNLVVGYSQDHYGYLLEEEDWLHGGYEPTVSPWGWKFGPYLINEVKTLVDTRAADAGQPTPDVPATPAPTADETHPVHDSMNAPHITLEPADGERLTTHQLKFEGGDPGLGSPQVALEQKVNGTFAPVQASAVRAIVNGPEIMLQYVANPSVAAHPELTTRVHGWTALFETIPTTPVGEYRLVVTGKARVAGAVNPYRLESRTFTVTPSRQVADKREAKLLADGRLAVTLRYPPNPTEYNSNHDVVRSYRVRDLNSDPRLGALVRGGSIRAQVTPPGGSAQALTLTWDAASDAYVGALPSGSGTFSIEVAAGQATDETMNSNAAAFTLSVTRP